MNDVVENVEVEISVVLGRTEMSIRDFLKIGRGAVIDLDTGHEEECWIYAKSAACNGSTSVRTRASRPPSMASTISRSKAA